MIRFVTYYVKPNAEERERIITNYRLVHHRDYTPVANVDETLSILHASVKKYHPKAEFLLLTDQTSSFKLDPDIKIMRYPRRSDELDREVIFALIYYLKHSKEKVDTIFLEWDQIVQADLTSLFEQNADLYFTYRRITPTPIDDAFIGIGSRSFVDVIDFFTILLDEYNRLGSDKLRYWLGKSLILSLLFFDRMLKAAAKGKRVIAYILKNTKIVLIDGKKYAKKLQAGEEKQFQPLARTVHFSNKKSRYLKEYWESFVKP